MKNTINKADWPLNYMEHLFGIFMDSERHLPEDYHGSLEYALITMLTEEEQKAVRLRYQEGMTYREIGEIFGVERGRVEAILRKSFKKLRHPSRSKYLLYGVSGYIGRYCERWEEDTFNKGYQKGYQDGFLKGSTIETVEMALRADFGGQNTELLMEMDPIDNLDLNVRTYNCLKRANINTVGELTCKTRSELFQLRNLGKRSLDDLEKRLKIHSLALREEAPMV